MLKSLRQHWPFLLPIACILPVVLFGFYFLLRPLPAAVSYDQAVYLPERSALCGGETLVYSNTLTITRAPITVYFGTSWWRGHGITAQPMIPGNAVDEKAQPFLYPITVGPKRRENVIPRGLSPAAYEMRFYATDELSKSAIHAVPFTIRPGCPAPP